PAHSTPPPPPMFASERTRPPRLATPSPSGLRPTPPSEAHRPTHQKRQGAESGGPLRCGSRPSLPSPRLPLAVPRKARPWRVSAGVSRRRAVAPSARFLALPVPEFYLMLWPPLHWRFFGVLPS